MSAHVRVDTTAWQAWHGAQLLQLPRLQFRLLALLVANAGQVVTIEQIGQDVWDGYPPSRQTLHMHLTGVRRALGDDVADPFHVVTVRGVGFRFRQELVVSRPRTVSGVARDRVAFALADAYPDLAADPARLRGIAATAIQAMEEAQNA
ncbi:winged helix-turn-helix domain-containing protein [Microtetraspora sp. AC03309]|uniref:winged helix-turn-helix domain-containing protein n=1 Tax=Microtetraspora sp. AC03309 TaxID=2779376 RepID=UPI001E339E86|nr:helix-turn-helix domain-containing protein [Microtetraspora sp. AC03309]MCC5574540.1 winged helix-turn-helix domain-containing protein [Microtetraspora sp. AC03309]